MFSLFLMDLSCRKAEDQVVEETCAFAVGLDFYFIMVGYILFGWFFLIILSSQNSLISMQGTC